MSPPFGLVVEQDRSGKQLRAPEREELQPAASRAGGMSVIPNRDAETPEMRTSASAGAVPVCRDGKREPALRSLSCALVEPGPGDDLHGLQVGLPVFPVHEPALSAVVRLPEQLALGPRRGADRLGEVGGLVLLLRLACPEVDDD